MATQDFSSSGLISTGTKTVSNDDGQSQEPLPGTVGLPYEPTAVIIPGNAISSIVGSVARDNWNPVIQFCPAGTRLDDTVVPGVCVTRYSGGNTAIISDVRVVNEGSSCPAGFTQTSTLRSFQKSNANLASNYYFQPLCVKTQLANTASQFVTRIYRPFSRVFSCWPGDFVVGQDQVDPHDNVSSRLICASIRNTERPKSVLTSVRVASATVPGTTVGCNPGEASLTYNYNVGQVEDPNYTSNLLGLIPGSVCGISSAVENASQVIEDARLLNKGEDCPAGYNLVGKINDPRAYQNDAQQPLCLLMKKPETAAKMLTRLYRVNKNEPCLSGDTQIGNLVVYGQGLYDYPMGTVAYCASF